MLMRVIPRDWRKWKSEGEEEHRISVFPIFMSIIFLHDYNLRINI